MSGFRKYQHVMRWGNQEVAGINAGTCLVFPKLDGANASVWIEDDEVHAGSRNRHLSLLNDNQGFCDWAKKSHQIWSLLKECPHWLLYGEWLVPHTIRTYRDEAWRRFYVFDVVDRETCQYVPYEEYRLTCEHHGVDYVPCMAIVENGRYEQFLRLAEQNDYLMKPGELGEGIVIKNYSFTNKYGRQTWAKIVRSEFREQNHKVFGPATVKGPDLTEHKIVETAVSQTLVNKERAKLESLLENGERFPIQPRLLHTIYDCVLREELPHLIKKMKNPTIDFKLLNRLSVDKTKELAPDLF